MTEFVFVYMTFENQSQAESVAEVLVTEGFSACVNVFPAMRSIYKWEGQLQNNEEVVAIAKTRKSTFGELEAKVRELHTYATPCIIGLEVTEGNADFLNWIRTQTK